MNWKYKLGKFKMFWKNIIYQVNKFKNQYYLLKKKYWILMMNQQIDYDNGYIWKWKDKCIQMFIIQDNMAVLI